MELTWTISGVCGRWQCTVNVEPTEDSVWEPEPEETTQALQTLEQHFLTLVNLLETKTMWERDGERRRW